MTWVYEQYLVHEWVFWPAACLEVAMMLMRRIFWVLAWFPLKLRELAYKDPTELLEMISATSALLIALVAEAQIPFSWLVLSGVVGSTQLFAICRRNPEGRFIAMIIATVFWWTLMFALLPRRMTGYHVFLVPLCIAYTVTTYAHLRNHHNT